MTATSPHHIPRTAAASRAHGRRPAELERRVDAAASRCALGEPSALVHLEVDGAWDLRDAGGPPAVEALREAVRATVAGRLRADVHRDPDRLCAFCLVLEDTSLAAAVREARAVKEAVNALRFVWRDRAFRVAAWVGVLELGHGFSSPEAWLASAREASAAARELSGTGVQAVALDDHAWSDLARSREWARHLTEIIG